MGVSVIINPVHVVLTLFLNYFFENLPVYKLARSTLFDMRPMIMYPGALLMCTHSNNTREITLKQSVVVLNELLNNIQNIIECEIIIRRVCGDSSAYVYSNRVVFNSLSFPMSGENQYLEGTAPNNVHSNNCY